MGDPSTAPIPFSPRTGAALGTHAGGNGAVARCRPPPGRAPRSDTAPRTPPERRLVPLFSNGQGTGTSLRGGGSTHARSLSAPGTPGLCSPSETPGRGGCRRIRGTGAASRRCPRSPGRLRDAQVGAAEPSGGAGGAGPFGFPVFVLPPRPGNEEAAEGRTGAELGAHRAEHRAQRHREGARDRDRAAAPNPRPRVQPGPCPAGTASFPFPRAVPPVQLSPMRCAALRSDRTEPRTARFSSVRFDSFRRSPSRCSSSR